MLSERAQQIPPFLVMEILEKAKSLERDGADIIHLEIGEPDFPTPVKIRQAAIRALEQGKTHYTHSLGILPLREAIADHYRKKYNVVVSPEQVIVTMGTSPALLLLLSTLVNPGDEVILSDPCYACYPNFIRYVNGQVVSIPVHAKEGFVLQPETIKKKVTSHTKAIMINSPSNPTGTVLSAAILKAITETGPYIISDEIYHGLTYGAEEHSILEFTDRAFVLNGFSKYYAMTGWRLGYIIAPTDFVRPMQKLQQNLFICASSISQWAGVVALTKHHSELDDMVAIYDTRRKFLLKSLRELGFKVAVEPQGAFYILSDARRFTSNSFQFSLDILEKAHVAVTAGVDFGKNAEGFLRFSYANSLQNIEKAMIRLEKYLVDG